MQEEIQMITLSNGHIFKYMAASGALAYNGKGWPWEWILRWFGFLKPELFTVVTKTLTLNPRYGNFCWWNPLTWLPGSPLSCLGFVPGGTVNKVGLTNLGIRWWCRNVGSRTDSNKIPLVVSIYADFGNENELVRMAEMLNDGKYDVVGIEVNTSCPNTGHTQQKTDAVVAAVTAVKRATRHPVIVKVSVVQDYLEIARRLKGVAEAISLNSVPWELVFPGKRTPLWLLEKRVGGGGGGVSGKPARELNWKAVDELCRLGALPVIAPSVTDFDSVQYMWELGAGAIGFGSIFLRTPWRPTAIVKKEMALLSQNPYAGDPYGFDHASHAG